MKKREACLPPTLSSENFAITNKAYGLTGELWDCAECGFRESPFLTEVIAYYRGLEDPTYEATRHERARQERALVEQVRRFQRSGRLLDIGAGSGILIEQARQLGYDALGIEPSRWLQQKAAERGLPVRCGVFPHGEAQGPFDVITLVDVLEHVANPVSLLAEIREALGERGVALIVTPDCSSLAARTLGWKWWHYRVAHIGYFNRKTLRLALEKAGLEPLAWSRPTWFFPASYLIDRINHYLPRWLALPNPSWTHQIVIPLNPRDSLTVVCRKAVKASPQ